MNSLIVLGQSPLTGIECPMVYTSGSSVVGRRVRTTLTLTFIVAKQLRIFADLLQVDAPLSGYDEVLHVEGYDTNVLLRYKRQETEVMTDCALLASCPALHTWLRAVGS